MAAISGMVSSPAWVGRVAAGQLEVLAEERRAAEHRDADGDAGDDHQDGGAVGEQPQRDQRLGGPELTGTVPTSSTAVAPRKAAVCQRHQAKSLPAKVTQIIGRLAVDGEQDRAEVVDLRVPADRVGRAGWPAG